MVTTPELGAEHELQFVLLTPDGNQLSMATAKILANGPPENYGESPGSGASRDRRALA